LGRPFSAFQASAAAGVSSGSSSQGVTIGCRGGGHRYEGPL